jgi:glycosyltransferase involved in cell wall biosynthesis
MPICRFISRLSQAKLTKRHHSDMSSPPALTVGLPFFNADSFLDSAIQSVVSQTFIDWELLLFDDGSTDNSREIAQCWAEKDTRIKVVFDGQKRGLPTCLNQLAHLAKGQYLARMDADDQMLPDRLARQVAFLTKNPSVDVVGSAATLLDTAGQMIGMLRPEFPRTTSEAARHGCFVHPTVMGKTAWFRQNPYNPTLRFAEDHDLWTRTFAKSRFYVLPDVLLKYRQPNDWQKHIGAMHELRSLVADWPVSPAEKQRLQRYFWLKEIAFLVFNRLKISQKIVNKIRWSVKITPYRVGEPLFIQVFTVPMSLQFMAGQAAFWQSQGFQLQVVCSGEDETRKFTEQEQIGYRIVPFRRGIALGQDLICLLKLYRIFRRLRPAVVQGNTPKAGFLAMLAARLAGVPTRIYELHGLPLETRHGPARNLFWLLEKMTCTLAGQVWAVSASLRAVALHAQLVSPEKITVPHHGSCNGVDAAGRFNPAMTEANKTDLLRQKLHIRGPVVGFVGRLCTDKGLAELTKTWALLRADYPDLTLLIVGLPECETKKEQRYLSDLQRDNTVRFIEWVTDIENYLALMDVLILPTHREGMPTVLLEAAAMQIPVVASRVTGVVDAVVDGETGFLVDNQSPAAFAEAISVYLNNPELARQHGQQARKRVLHNFLPNDVWVSKANFLQTNRL